MNRFSTVGIAIVIACCLASCVRGAKHTPSQHTLEKISDNVYLFRDTCNVYVLKQNDKAILIDFG